MWYIISSNHLHIASTLNAFFSFIIRCSFISLFSRFFISLVEAAFGSLNYRLFSVWNWLSQEIFRYPRALYCDLFLLTGPLMRNSSL